MINEEGNTGELNTFYSDLQKLAKHGVPVTDAGSPTYSDAVKKLQIGLQFLGFDFPKYGADGYFGQETKNAISQFKNLLYSRAGNTNIKTIPNKQPSISTSNVESPKTSQDSWVPKIISPKADEINENSLKFNERIRRVNEERTVNVLEPDVVDALISRLKKQDFKPEDIKKYSLPTDFSKAKIKGSANFPKENIEAINAAMDRHNITNEYARKAILGVISKESPALEDERSYANTSPQRIQAIWPSRFADKSAEEINRIKKQDSFWDLIYGGRYGNDKPRDGAKYRGRGFNQLTFKNNYRALQKEYENSGAPLGDINIVENPELLSNNKDVAAEFAVLYFKRAFDIANKDMNNYNNLESAVRDYVQANAGWNTPLTNADVAQGHQKALAFASQLGDSSVGTA